MACPNAFASGGRCCHFLLPTFRSIRFEVCVHSCFFCVIGTLFFRSPQANSQLDFPSPSQARSHAKAPASTHSDKGTQKVTILLHSFFVHCSLPVAHLVAGACVSLAPDEARQCFRLVRTGGVCVRGTAKKKAVNCTSM